MAEQQESQAATADSLSSSSVGHEHQSESTTSSPPSDPSAFLSRSVSSSKLNARAPEFVPRTSSSSSSPASPSSLASSSSSPAAASSSVTRTDMAPASFVMPSPVHVYNAGGAAPFHHHVPPMASAAAAAAAAANFQNPYVYAGHHVPLPYHQGGQFYGLVDKQHDLAALVVQPSQPRAGKSDSDQGVKNGGLSEETAQKIINQVEYYFSDINLATTEHLMRLMSKDPEGYVPMSVVSSFKKIKALVNSNSQLAIILRRSTKLVVSEDGKKVKRQHRLTDLDMEELQSRIVVAENLPEDHCHQNLMKIFSAVGSVKMIRTCQPQTSNSGASSTSRTKGDGMLFSNKLHAFVEYETVDLAEKAVTELNDEDNWRNGLKVRLLLRRTAKSAQVRMKKVGADGDSNSQEDEATALEPQQLNDKHLEDSFQQSDVCSGELPEEHANDKEGQRKGRGRGRGKGRGRPQYHNSRGSHVGTPTSNVSRGSLTGTPPSSAKSGNHVGNSPSTRGSANGTLPSVGSTSGEQLNAAKQPSVPRMPDGTRGFSMGRGKPVAVRSA